MAYIRHILQLTVRPYVRLLQVWYSFTEYLLGIAVAIPGRTQVNALPRSQKIYHSYSEFDRTILAVYLE